MNVVYMIAPSDRSHVKIGWSDSLYTRLAAIQMSHWLKLDVIRAFAGGVSDEANLHRMFAHLYVRGEWFRFDESMMGDVGLDEVSIADTLKPRWPPDAPGHLNKQAFRQTCRILGRGFAHPDSEEFQSVYRKLMEQNDMIYTQSRHERAALCDIFKWQPSIEEPMKPYWWKPKSMEKLAARGYVRRDASTGAFFITQAGIDHARQSIAPGRAA